MDGNKLYSSYQNQLIEIEFEPSSESYNMYGSSLIGFLYFPMPSPNSIFYEDIKISENTTLSNQLIRLAFKITAGFKLKNNISDEVEKSLMEKGFLCKDVLRVIPSNGISLTVTGFPLKENISFFNVSGIWTYNQHSSIVSLNKNGSKKIDITGNNFHAFCDEIRGCKPDFVAQILKKHNISYNVNKDEIDLLKSLCNIFIWLEYYFVEGDISPDPQKLVNNSEFLPKMYDEFIIDYTGVAETQNDIYLIKQHYQTEDTKNLLEQLVELNLLSKVTLKIKHNEFTNYFIPFTKLEYKSLFLERRGLFTIYKQLMYDRHLCISNFYNNR